MTPARWRPRSLRARMTVLATALVSVALVAASYGLLAALERSLTAERDALSRSRAAALAAQAAAGSLPPVLTDLGEDGMAQVVTADGRVLAASPGLLGQPAIDAEPPTGTRPALQVLRDVPDDDETEDYRVWARRVPTPRGEVAVYVGASLETVAEATRALRRGLLVGIPALLALLVLGTRLVVDGSLRPVEEIRRQVAEMAHQARLGRVPVPPTGDELERLAETMNVLLERLEAAGERQRAFVADASHELQSPLTALRAQLEVALAHPNGTEWAPLARDLLADTVRLERLVRDLLFLAREDAEVPVPRDTLVDLDVVVEEEALRLRGTSRVTVDVGGVTAAPVRGHADDLRRVVRNLVDNAVAHAATRVVITLASSSDEARLEVADDGPGIPADQRERVFERFGRVESAREHGTGGSGLGLAIVRTVVERHGGTVHAESVAPHGVRMVVRLPAAHPRTRPHATSGGVS